MNTAKSHSIYLFLLCLVLTLIGEPVVLAQNQTGNTSDTLVYRIKTINPSEISVRAAEVIISSNRIYKSIISDNELNALKEKNDSITNFLDSLLAQEDIVENIRSRNIRNLNNTIVFWNMLSQRLNSEKQQLLSVNETIDEQIEKIEEELITWNNTKESFIQQDKGEALIVSTKDVISQLEDTRERIRIKGDMLIRMLNKTAELEIHIVEYKDVVNRALIAQKSKVFESQQQSVFAFEFSDKSIWSIKKPIKKFYYLEVVQLAEYLKGSIFNSVLLLILLVILIVVFKQIRPYFSGSETNKSIYLQKLNSFINRNVGMAVILTIFMSAVVFPNRPELFKNISRIIVIFPLISIFQQIIEPRFYRYLYVLVAAILIQTASYIFPPSHIFYRTALIVVAILEIIAFWSLLKYFFNFQFPKSIFRSFSLLFLMIHIAFALTGLLATIFGSARLAELTLNAPISNAFTAILIVITLIILNGLIQFTLEGPYLKDLNVVRLYGKEIIKKSIQLINIGGLVLWIYTMLRIITLERIVLDGIKAFFSNELSIGVISFSLGGIIVFFLVIWLSIVISKFINIILERDILNRFKLAKGVPHTIGLLVRYTLITLGVVLAVGAAGLPLQNFTILFGAFGVGIGFGLQNIFNNLVSGLILLFERPIQIGDTIEVGELIGTVKSIGIRSSNVRTFDGAEVIVPNGQLISNEVVNWTLSDQQRRIEIIAGVSYNSDPHKVKTILTKVLDNHPDIIKHPEPYVLFNNMGESSLDFRLLFWTANIGEWLRIQSEVTFMVHDSLKEAGIEIPYPQRDLHIRSVDDSVNISKKETDGDVKK